MVWMTLFMKWFVCGRWRKQSVKLALCRKVWGTNSFRVCLRYRRLGCDPVPHAGMPMPTAAPNSCSKLQPSAMSEVQWENLQIERRWDKVDACWHALGDKCCSWTSCLDSFLHDIRDSEHQFSSLSNHDVSVINNDQIRNQNINR